eukprot:1159910-Pelagomonas_calceolata.AAC.3
MHAGHGSASSETLTLLEGTYCSTSQCASLPSMDVRKASQQLFPMQHALTALGPLSRQACRNIAQTAGGCPNFKPESPIQSIRQMKCKSTRSVPNSNKGAQAQPSCTQLLPRKHWPACRFTVLQPFEAPRYLAARQPRAHCTGWLHP